ncbi:hypothetical protein FOZ63_021448 [Perkinsus olseni]|uniref:Uncharacterized protein n=1 Tax=Perkinsus olseni TaxID=32597 RepID=A0A7J6QUX9_PEROL|nr:hypothetical protein FOZ63_021448 [Perkinsus olseni]
MDLITEDEFLNRGKKYRAEVLDCLKTSAKHKRAPIIDMFNDVYDDMPWHLREHIIRYDDLKAHIDRNTTAYNLSLYQQQP